MDDLGSLSDLTLYAILAIGTIVVVALAIIAALGIVVSVDRRSIRRWYRRRNDNRWWPR